MTPAAGIREREKRRNETLRRELPKARPGAWGCVQARELWSTKEEIHLRPGHHWLCEFGDAGDGTSVEKTFTLPRGKFEVYKGVRFYDGDSALVVKRWLHRVDEDASGLTFATWDPTADADPEAPPAELIVNSSELRGAGFKLVTVRPPALQLPPGACGVFSRTRTRKATVIELEGVGVKHVLDVDVDNELRARCQ